jgi:hypothetical protein
MAIARKPTQTEKSAKPSAKAGVIAERRAREIRETKRVKSGEIGAGNDKSKSGEVLPSLKGLLPAKLRAEIVEAAKNMTAGKVSEPVDFAELEKLAG